MMPRLQPGDYIKTDEYKQYKERGQRGACTYQITFWHWGEEYKIDFWWTNGSGEKDATDRRKKRALRRCKRQLEGVIGLWATSEYKYIMDLNDFVMAALKTKD